MHRDALLSQRTKPYVLLRDVMRDSGLVAVTKVTMRERESLAVLRVLEDVLVLQTIRWPDEIRPSTGIKVPSREPIHKNEIQMALQLAASMSEGYDLNAERDRYVQALKEILAAKAGGGEVKPGAEPTAAAAPTVDLMAALQASIAESQAKRGETPAPTKSAAKRVTAKRTPRRAS